MATAERDFVDELAQILASAGALAKITPSRLARSTLYDLHYHVAIVACAMRQHGEGVNKQILAPWLKLLQFVAARPTLVDPLVRYAAVKRRSTREFWEQLPRGYLGDTTHEGVVDLLVASDVLQNADGTVQAGSRYTLLDVLASHIETDGLFRAEREILAQLRQVKITKVLLGAS